MWGDFHVLVSLQINTTSISTNQTTAAAESSCRMSSLAASGESENDRQINPLKNVVVVPNMYQRQERPSSFHNSFKQRTASTKSGASCAATENLHKKHGYNREYRGNRQKDSWFRSKRRKTTATPISTKAGTCCRPVSALTLLQEARSKIPRQLCLLRSKATNQNDHHNGHKQNWTEGNCDDDACWLKLGVGVHELAGEAGTGKTQMALSLCIAAAAGTETSEGSGNCRAMYLNLGGMPGVRWRGGEFANVAARLNQMAKATVRELQQRQQTVFPQKNNSNGNGNSSNASSTYTVPSTRQLLERIQLSSVLNEEDLFELLAGKLQKQMARHKGHIKILILDSIADLYRGGGAYGGGAVEAKAQLFHIAALLKKLSHQFQVPVLVINQVVAVVQSKQNVAGTRLSSILPLPCDGLKPALGLSWANCVNTSYLTSRKEIFSNLSYNIGRASRFERSLSLYKASHTACCQSASFCIQEAGVFLLKP